MKNIDGVAKALLFLQENAVEDFEKVAVEQLITRLLNPPRVTVIDDEHQGFEGKIYTKDSSGYYKFGKPLHRVVWEYFNGKIPSGYVIHHKDHNRANNNIENLQMMTRKEHSLTHYPDSLPVAAPKKRTFICQFCGKEYEAFDNGKNKFCSTKCTNEFRKRHLKKTCKYCGKEFWTSRKSVNYCSKSCGLKGIATVYDKVCPICEKKFQTTRKAQKYCSKDCAKKSKLMSIKRKAFERLNKISVCKRCGKTFSGLESHHQEFCSDYCATRFYFVNKTVTKNCVICGKEFETPKNRQALTCSWKCANTLRWNNRREKEKNQPLS